MAEFFARLVPKKSTQPGEVPNPDLDLIEGEIAVNTADGKIWTKHSDGTLVPLGGGGDGGSVGDVFRRTAQFWGNSKKTTDTPAEVVGAGAWCIRTDLQGITVSEFSADGTRFDGNAYTSGSTITLTVAGQELAFTLAADPTQVVDQLFTFEFTEDTTSLNNLLNGTDLVAIGLVTTDAEDGDILTWSDACQCWLAEPPEPFPPFPDYQEPLPIPVPPITGEVPVLLSFDDPDESARPYYVTNRGTYDVAVNRNDDPIKTDGGKFGAGYVDGLNIYRYLRVENGTQYQDAINFGTGDFTIEFWLKCSDHRAYNRGILGHFGSYGLQLGVTATSATETTFSIRLGSVLSAQTSADMADGEWHHVAVTRASGSVEFWLDGTAISDGSLTDTTNMTGAAWLIATAWNGNALYGQLDEFRIIKGQAYYTEAFTPSDVPLPVSSPDNPLLGWDGENWVPASAPVTSVNEQTGDVSLGMLDLDDVTADDPLVEGDVLRWDDTEQAFRPAQQIERIQDASDFALNVTQPLPEESASRINTGSTDSSGDSGELFPYATDVYICKNNADGIDESAKVPALNSGAGNISILIDGTVYTSAYTNVIAWASGADSNWVRLLGARTGDLATALDNSVGQTVVVVPPDFVLAEIPLAEGDHLRWSDADQAFMPVQLSYNDLTDQPTIPPEVEPGISRIQDADDYKPQWEPSGAPIGEWEFRGSQALVGMCGREGDAVKASGYIQVNPTDVFGDDHEDAVLALLGQTAWVEVAGVRAEVNFNGAPDLPQCRIYWTDTGMPPVALGDRLKIWPAGVTPADEDVPAALVEGDVLRWSVGHNAFRPVPLDPVFSGDYNDLANTPDLSLKADLVGGKVPADQLPAIAISEFLGTVADEAAMLALTGQSGDWCVRVDTDSAWILSADDASVLANWIELGGGGAGGVVSVNDKTGAVSLGVQDMNDYDLRTYTPPMQRWDQAVAMNCNSTPTLLNPGNFIGPTTCWSNWIFFLGATDADGNEFGADAWPSTLEAGDTVYLLTDLEADWVPYQLKNKPSWTSNRGWDLDPDSNGVSLTGGFTWIQASPAPGPAHVDIPMEFGDVLVWDDDAVHGAAFRPKALSYSDLPDTPTLAAVATSGSYGDLVDVPDEFAPESHTHDISEITGQTFPAPQFVYGWGGPKGIYNDPDGGITMDFPATAITGDLAIVMIAARNNTEAVGVPTDWATDGGAEDGWTRHDQRLWDSEETFTSKAFQALFTKTLTAEDIATGWVRFAATPNEPGISDHFPKLLIYRNAQVLDWNHWDSVAPGVKHTGYKTFPNSLPLTQSVVGVALGYNVYSWIDPDLTTWRVRKDDGVVTEHLGTFTDIEKRVGSFEIKGDNTAFDIAFSQGATASTNVQMTDGVHLYVLRLSYVDPSQQATDWLDIVNKPTEYPPEAHTHRIQDADDFKLNQLVSAVGGIRVRVLPTDIDTTTNGFAQENENFIIDHIGAGDVNEYENDGWISQIEMGSTLVVLDPDDNQVTTEVLSNPNHEQVGSYAPRTWFGVSTEFRDAMQALPMGAEIRIGLGAVYDPESPVIPLAQGDVLSWDAGREAFTPEQLNLPASYVTSLDDLDDVDTTTTAPTDKQVLAWDESQLRWMPRTDPAAPVQSVQDKTGDVRLTIQEMDDFTLAITDSVMVWNRGYESNLGEWNSQGQQYWYVNFFDADGVDQKQVLIDHYQGGGSFWLSTNNDPFLLAGISLVGVITDFVQLNVNNYASYTQAGPLRISLVDPGTGEVPLANEDVLFWDADASKFIPRQLSYDDLADQPAIPSTYVESINNLDGVVTFGMNDLSDVVSDYTPDNRAEWTQLASGTPTNRAPKSPGQWGYFEGGEDNRQLRLNYLDGSGTDWEPVMSGMPASGTLYVSQDDVTFLALPYRAKSHNTTDGYWSFFVDPYVPPKVDGSLFVSLQPPESPNFQPFAQGSHLEFTGTLWQPVQLATVAKSGSYNDLDDLPVIPTPPARVSDGVLAEALAAGDTALGWLEMAGKAGMFISVTTDQPAWVRFYSDANTRAADIASERAMDENPTRGSGVLLEVITDGTSVYKITPALHYFNAEDPDPQGRLAVAITNTDGTATQDIQLTVEVLPLET